MCKVVNELSNCSLIYLLFNLNSILDHLIDAKSSTSKNTPVPNDIQQIMLKCYLSKISIVMNEELLDVSVNFIKQKLEAFANTVDLFNM